VKKRKRKSKRLTHQSKTLKVTLKEEETDALVSREEG
jgi:DNA-binding HxlR family transcriptional regulator